MPASTDTANGTAVIHPAEVVIIPIIQDAKISANKLVVIDAVVIKIFTIVVFESRLLKAS